MATVPNIVTGRVTNSQRRTPNWLKAVYAALAALVVIVTVSLIFAPSSDSLPPCKSEDGSGQSACYWDADTMGNGEGKDVIFLDGQVFVESK